MPFPGADRHSPRILLIDDDAVSREVLAMMLEMHGFPCESAEDGQQALALLNAVAKESAPEVILMDTQMPGLSGIALIHALREHSTARIIAISGSDPEGGIRDEADGFLLKPIQPEDLVRLMGAMDGIGGSASAEEPAGVVTIQAQAALDGTSDQPPVDEAIDAVSDEVTDAVIDPVVLGKLNAMMPAAAVKEIYLAVASDLGTRIKALEAAMETDDMVEVRRIAHAIKGGCSMVGLSGATGAASRLETGNQREAWPKELLRLQLAREALQGILDDGLPW